MKLCRITLAFTTLLLGCASSKPPQPFLFTPAIDVVIESAMFGAGANTTDVTVRLVHILDDNPGGIFPTPYWLDANPAPNKNQSLVINYWYHGKQYRLIAIGNERISYQSLAEHAENSTIPSTGS